MGVGIHMTRRCIPYVPYNLREQVCRSLILFHLDYCAVIWGSASKGKLARLQVAQPRAARLVLGCSPRTSIQKMYSSLSWLNIEKRLQSSTVTFLNNTIRSHKPEFLHNQIVFCNSVHQYNTRKAANGDIVEALAKNKSLTRTVLYRATELWNSLPIVVRQASSKIAFKRSLKIHLLND